MIVMMLRDARIPKPSTFSAYVDPLREAITPPDRMLSIECFELKRGYTYGMEDAHARMLIDLGLAIG